MGIKSLTQSIQRYSPGSIQSENLYKLSGKKVAVDASLVIYQQLLNRQKIFKNNEGKVTNHITGLFYKIMNYISLNIELLFVFDGKPPDNKQECIALRKEKSKKAKELTEKAKADKEKILAHPAIYPMDIGAKRLSSQFGYRRDPFSQKYKFHDGHDYSAQIGTPVYSTANGRVKKSKYWGSFGNYIEVDHGNGYITAYGHLSTRNVKAGDKVYRGQKIGEVGNTGRSTAPHLHYEIQYQNKAIDPTPFYFDISIN